MTELRDKALRHVLQCFESMGATHEDLETEKTRLNDDGYLDLWASVCSFYVDNVPLQGER